VPGLAEEANMKEIAVMVPESKTQQKGTGDQQKILRKLKTPRLDARIFREQSHRKTDGLAWEILGRQRGIVPKPRQLRSGQRRLRNTGGGRFPNLVSHEKQKWAAFHRSGLFEIEGRGRMKSPSMEPCFKARRAARQKMG